ncbi:MAG TPA: YggS family pyridoxal phosphate-dependent enzyme [Candidatus Ozemobacteraceae bacterium]|nr:YggS family pyridoxal phosphate-dependent enzyme [Candidatus Ozemobacteraceae bacterium]
MIDITRNLADVKTRIAQAAQRAGRSPETVKLVAITKTVGVSEIRQLIAAGQTTFGENRPQALRDKVTELTGVKSIHWHLVGTLQSNKIKYVYPVAEMIHSIDRRDLFEDLARWTAKSGRACPLLIEVHISPEDTKHGFAPEEILPLLRELRSRDDLNVQGLMGMAPFTDDLEMIRRCFRGLAELFQRSRELEGPGYHALELSMGMTDDFEIAIEEGATLVRIGRALFVDEHGNDPSA